MVDRHGTTPNAQPSSSPTNDRSRTRNPFASFGSVACAVTDAVRVAGALAVDRVAEDGVAVVETDGFVLDQVAGVNNGEHGLAVYGADHGLIADCTASTLP